MRQILILICCCFTMANTTPNLSSYPKKTKRKTTLKVLTWNIQMLSLPWIQKMQKRRSTWIIKELKNKDIDIIVFQEVFGKKICKKLQRELKEQYPYQIKPIKPKRMRPSNGVLILSKLPLTQLGYCVYTEGLYFDKFGKKGCVFVEGKKNGKSFQLGGTHLQAWDNVDAQAVRQTQYEQIYKELLAFYQKKDVVQIIVGDMNTEKNIKKHYEAMLSALHMKDVPLDDERPYTYDEQNSWNKENKYGDLQLDYVLLNPHQTQSKIVEQKVFRPTKKHKGKTIDLADHYGILATIELH